MGNCCPKTFARPIFSWSIVRDKIFSKHPEKSKDSDQGVAYEPQGADREPEQVSPSVLPPSPSSSENIQPAFVAPKVDIPPTPRDTQVQLISLEKEDSLTYTEDTTDMKANMSEQDGFVHIN
jgi:hypothetical protein